MNFEVECLNQFCPTRSPWAACGHWLISSSQPEQAKF